MVWRNSALTGFGLAFTDHRDKEGLYSMYVIAEYDPIGNIPNEFGSNVVKRP